MNADELDPKPAEPLSAANGKEAVRPGEELQEQPAPKRPGSAIAVLALLLAALASAAVVWLWWQGDIDQDRQATQLQMREQQHLAGLQRLEQALAAAQNLASQQSSSQVTALSGDLERRLKALEAAQTANQDFRSETSAWTRSAQAALNDAQTRLNSVDERLRTLTARSAQSDSELELEEIDYLLRMAQERLQLFGDTRNADRALQLADHQVVAFDNPMFISLRREIAAARQALAATDVPDMAALAAELDKVQDSLATLPFKTSEYESAAQATKNDTDSSWWQRLKNSLSGLITVRRVASDELALPALADQQALRQRVWLQIEQARLAALSREQDIYSDALLQAEGTIKRWFDADDARVKQILSGVKALQQRNVNPPMPDISGPWNTLRSIRGAGLSPTVGPTVSPAATPPVTAGEIINPVQPVPDSSADSSPANSDEPKSESDEGNNSNTGASDPVDSDPVDSDPVDSDQ